MALFADGGIVGSKPYAASGAYINRMSNYCADCKYNVKDKLGEAACPFNYLYWDFIMRHETQLAGNPRMALVYKNLNKMPHNQKSEIARQAEYFLSSLDRIGPRP
jgi:deoxyribodipyrimidine photolyase-related protein